MSASFALDAPSISVSVVVVGPRRNYDLRCRIDTGSEMTVLPASFLRALGYDLSRPVKRTRLRSVTGAAHAPVVRISAIAALERVRTDFLVAAHDLPAGTSTDGLLGLDFFRGYVLRLDFIHGRIDLFQKHWWQFWR